MSASLYRDRCRRVGVVANGGYLLLKMALFHYFFRNFQSENVFGNFELVESLVFDSLA